MCVDGIESDGVCVYWVDRGDVNGCGSDSGAVAYVFMMLIVWPYLKVV